MKNRSNTRRGPLRAITPVAAATLLVALAACGSGSSSSATTRQSSFNSMSIAGLAKAADSEGQLTWYTTFSSDDVDPMIAAFKKVYPNIKVNALRLSADQLPPKIITEQRGGKYNADVVSGEAIQVTQLQQAGALEPYTPPALAPLPTGLTMPSGYRAIIYVNTTVPAYNPSILKAKGLPVPRTIADFTNPEWKGQFSIDPSAVNLYDSLIQQMGHAKALELVKKLGANDPSFVESHTEALTQVEAGEPAATATAYGYKAASESRKNPSQIQFVNPVPLPASLSLVSLGKNAPHPAAARLFEAWIESKAGQQAVVDVTNHASIRTDVKNDPSVWDPSKWQPSFNRPELPSKEFNSELAEFDKALGAQ